MQCARKCITTYVHQGGDSVLWYCPTSLADLYTLMTKHTNDNIRLVAGNTGKGTYILLTKHEGHTGRISALGLDSMDWAQRGPYRKDWGLIFSQYSPKQAWLIRDLLHGFVKLNHNNGKKLYPVRDLENIGPTRKHSDWLILVIGPLSLSHIINTYTVLLSSELKPQYYLYCPKTS